MNNGFNKIKNWWNDLDKYILIPTFILISIGVILVFSASQVLGSKYEVSQYFLIKKHIIFVTIAVKQVMLIICVNYQ